MWTCVPATGEDQVGQVLNYFLSFPDRINCSKTPCAFWRYLVNERLAEDDIIHDDAAEIALRARVYPFPAALSTEQGQHWWLQYTAAWKIYEITVKYEGRAVLSFDRSYPDACYSPRHQAMRADYEQLSEDPGYPLNAACNEDEEQEAEPPSKSGPKGTAERRLPL